MNEASHQSNGNGEDFVQTLSERLGRRATEPVGVIDVRYAEEKYLRIVRWLARCNALVDHLKRRYGVEDPTTDSQYPFAFRRLGEQVNVFSPTTQTFSSPGAEVQSAASDALQQPERGLANIIAERSSEPVIERPISLENSFRIRRRPPSESDGSVVSPRPGPDPATQQTAPDAGVSTTLITHITDFVFRNEVEQGSSVAKSTDAARRPGSASRVETIEEPHSAGSIKTQERRGSSALSNKQDGLSSTVRQEDQRASDASTVSVLPLITPIDSPPSRPPLLPLRSAGTAPPAQAGDTIGSSQTSSAAASATVAFEIPGNSFNPERPDLVWREHRVDPGGVVSTTQESRSLSKAQSNLVEFAPVAQQEGHIGSPASAPLQAQEVKAEHISPQVIRSISERVIRAITLDLKLERERRGITKWR